MCAYWPTRLYRLILYRPIVISITHSGRGGTELFNVLILLYLVQTFS